MTISVTPWTENKLFQLKSSGGTRRVKSEMPYLLRKLMRLGFNTMGSLLFNQVATIIPPSTIPVTKNKFHISFLQLYLKKEIFAGKQAAHICLNEEEIP